MAVETRVLVNGQWVTRTVDLNTVLRHHEQQDMQESHNPMQVEQTPVFGMLTQTVIQSPLVHHILPIRFRGLKFNDVAFIGVSSSLIPCSLLMNSGLDVLFTTRLSGNDNQLFMLSAFPATCVEQLCSILPAGRTKPLISTSGRICTNQRAKSRWLPVGSCTQGEFWCSDSQCSCRWLY